MRYGQITLEKEQSARLLGWGIRFFLTAALTASKTPGGYAPFALGCVAAAGPGGSGLAALAGAGVGAVLFLDFADALPFLATAVLIFTTSTALRGIWLEKKRWFPAAVGVALFLAVGGIYVIQSLDPLGHVTDWAAAAILLGAAALMFLALKAGNMSSLSFDKTYTVSSRFDNIGGLKPRAPVKSAGVVVGRVGDISFDDQDYRALVTLQLQEKYKFPKDSSAKILTSGLLGEQYIGIEPGGDETYLASGDQIQMTQSAIVLENLISQFIYSKATE